MGTTTRAAARRKVVVKYDLGRNVERLAQQFRARYPQREPVEAQRPTEQVGQIGARTRTI
jgi:hypothetical protein